MSTILSKNSNTFGVMANVLLDPNHEEYHSKKNEIDNLSKDSQLELVGKIFKSCQLVDFEKLHGLKFTKVTEINNLILSKYDEKNRKILEISKNLLPNVESIKIIQFKSLNNNDIKLVMHNTAIKTLQICGDKIVLNEKALGEMPSLESLTIYRFSGKSIQDIQNFAPNLKDLGLPHLTYIDSQENASCKRVLSLDLTYYHGKNTEFLKAFPNLRKLDLSFSKIETLNIDKSAFLEQLSLFNCAELKLDQKFFDGLYNSIPNLKELDLQRCNITSLGNVIFYELSKLAISSDTLKSAEYEKLRTFAPRVKDLDLSGAKIEKLENLVFNSLEILSLCDCKKIPKEQFKYLKKFAPNLKSLNVVGTNFSDLNNVNIEELDKFMCNFSSLTPQEVEIVKNKFGNCVNLISEF